MIEQPHAVPDIVEPPPPPTGPLLGVLRTIDGWLVSVEKIILVALVGLILGLIFLQVIARLFIRFHSIDVAWTQPAAVLAMIGLSLFAASVTTHYRRHITIDIVSRALSPSTRTVLATVMDLFGSVVMLYLTRVAHFYVAVNKNDEVPPGLSMPFWYFRWLIPIAFGLMTFRFFVNFLENVKRIVTRTWLPLDRHHHGVDLRM